MVCTIVKAAISLDSKDRQEWASVYNQGDRPKTKFDCDNSERSELPCKLGSCNMRTVIVTEEVARAALRISSVPPRRTCNSEKRCNSSWDNVPWCKLGRKFQSCVFLCLGILLCSTFIFALCTVDARAVERKSGKFGFSKGTFVPDVSVNEGHENAPHRIEDRWEKEAAFRGLGVIFRKGTRSMDELIVANIEEYPNTQDFRLFFRTLHRSGATARTDVVLLFPWISIPKHVTDVVWEEDQNFRKLISLDSRSSQIAESGGKLVSTSGAIANISIFNALAFERGSSKNGDRNSSILWGDRSVSEEQKGMFGWGSIVGFEMNELDPDNFLSRFLINPPAQLRRWLCYQMLLGIFRRKFKRAMLVELGEVVILGDPFTPVRKRDGLYLTLEDRTWADPIVESRHHHDQQKTGAKKYKDRIEDTSGSNPQLHEVINISGNKPEGINREMRLKGGTVKKKKPSMMELVYGKELWGSLEKVEKEMKVVSSGVVIGSMRAVKGLANSMVTEIVRVAMQRKRSTKHPAFPDRALLSFLVQKSSVLGRKVTQNLRTESHEESVVHWVNDKASQQDLFFRAADGERYAVVQVGVPDDHDRTTAGNSGGFLANMIIADLCSDADALYKDCRHNNH